MILTFIIIQYIIKYKKDIYTEDINIKMSQELIVSKGWYLSRNPTTHQISLNLPESRYESSAKFTRFEEEQDVWMKVTSTHIYVLDWKTNARVIYIDAKERGEEVVDIPSEIFDNVFLSLEKTREIMNKLTIQ
jgi:hypothetical protein